MSCINRKVGHAPVEPGFAAVKGRPKWAIPWLEDDPALTSPQLWVGRMRRDAADARRYGCTGLMGIHWRTRVLGPNVPALAAGGLAAGLAAGAGQAVEGPIGGYPRCGRVGRRDRGRVGPDRLPQPALRAHRLPAAGSQRPLRASPCASPSCGSGPAAGLRRPGGGPRAPDRPRPREVAGAAPAFDSVARDVAVRDGWLDVGFVDHATSPASPRSRSRAAGAGAAHRRRRARPRRVGGRPRPAFVRSHPRSLPRLGGGELGRRRPTGGRHLDEPRLPAAAARPPGSRGRAA